MIHQLPLRSKHQHLHFKIRKSCEKLRTLLIQFPHPDIQVRTTASVLKFQTELCQIPVLFFRLRVLVFFTQLVQQITVKLLIFRAVFPNRCRLFLTAFKELLCAFCISLQNQKICLIQTHREALAILAADDFQLLLQLIQHQCLPV